MQTLILTTNLTSSNHKKASDIFREVIDIELDAIKEFRNRLTDSLQNIINLIYQSSGKVIITGIGKSGLVGKKIAATLSSTGTTSMFLHPSEAMHGDMGVIKKEDIVICISYSGETEEVLKLIPSLKSFGIPIIAFTGNLESTLARNSDYSINIKVDKEACPLKLTPTSSTTVTLVAGDALSIALMTMKGFRETDFAVFHPGGNLGRMLLSKVKDEMIVSPLPTIRENDSIKDVIISISESKLGLTVIVDEEMSIKGLITDGDLRRALSYEQELFTMKAKDLMNKSPIMIGKERMIREADLLMREKNVNALIVEDEGKLTGIIHIHKLQYGLIQ